MKKFLLVVMSIMMMGLTLVGCGSDTAEKGAGLSGAVSTNGSTSMEKVIGILSEQFMGDNKGVTITYDATGSGTGIEAVYWSFLPCFEGQREGKGPKGDYRSSGWYCYYRQ